MANWLQALEFTSEFTPGPWLLTGADIDSGAQMSLHGAAGGRTIATVHPTPNGRYPERRNGMLSTTWDDIEQESTARLMSEAPEMIRLLARWLMFSEGFQRKLRDAVKELDELDRETQSLLLRHSRTGVPAVDAVNHAPRTEAPPPPPPPTLFDEFDPVPE